MTSSTRQPIQAPAVPARGFRADIQGLRAVAVALVVLYHAGVSVISGGFVGVDVFFVVSGFLITTHLLESLERDGRISFGSFYARRARRILPASLAVVVLTVVASWLWMPPLQLRSVFEGAIATALYVPNLLFAVQGTDYLAETAPSVFQHYWSLGVEEQFYLFWPLILAVGFTLLRRSERSLFMLSAVLVAVSIALGAVLTISMQPWAFFSLPTRAWELGIGGLVAFLLRTNPRWIAHRAAGILGWIGLVALLLVAVAFDSSTLFPGLNALLPVTATALIIVGGARSGPWSPTRLLSVRPLQFIGLISYSLYLVHWPLLVIPQAAYGLESRLPLSVTLALGALAVPLSYLLYRFVENPCRNPSWVIAMRPRRSLQAAGIASLLIVGISAAALPAVTNVQLSTGKAAEEAAVDTTPVATGYVPANLTPALKDAERDNPEIYASRCHLPVPATDPVNCAFGTNEKVPSVVLFGDSHAAQWFPALQAKAEEGAIRLFSDTKSSCPSVEVPILVKGAPFIQCEQWQDKMIALLAQDPPDLIVLSNYSRPALDETQGSMSEQWGPGLARMIERLPASSRVAVIRDTADWGSTPAICLSANVDDTAACQQNVSDLLATDVAAAEREVVEASGATYVDLTDYLCDEQTCPLIIGTTLVYRDAHHLTATFSKELSDPLWSALEPLLRE